MTDEVIGTDIIRMWSFTDGDLDLVSESSNLGQAIVNRLNADENTYDIFYNRYGGALFEHFGDINSENILEYIRIEIESILQQDPKIRNIDCKVNKNENDTITINLNVTTISNNEVIPLNLILNNDEDITIIENTEIKDRSC